jgi:hypothetical protein
MFKYLIVNGMERRKRLFTPIPPNWREEKSFTGWNRTNAFNKIPLQCIQYGILLETLILPHYPNFISLKT